MSVSRIVLCKKMLTKKGRLHIIILASRIAMPIQARCGSVWLEHLVWDQGVAGSNPVTSIQFHIMQVWFNGRTSAFQAEYVGSIPITCSIKYLRINLRYFFRAALTLTLVSQGFGLRSAPVGAKPTSTGRRVPHHLLYFFCLNASVNRICDMIKLLTHIFS